MIYAALMPHFRASLLTWENFTEVTCRGEGHPKKIYCRITATSFKNIKEKIINTLTTSSWVDGLSLFASLQHCPPFHDTVELPLTQFDDKDIIIIGEKSPDNLLYLDLLGLIFPGKKVSVIFCDEPDHSVSG